MMGRPKNQGGGAPRRAWSPFTPTTPRGRMLPPGERMYQNNRYTVLVTPVTAGRPWEGVEHVSIRRNDRAAVRDWRDLQRIKNELCGPEREAVELYPAESRLVDESNQYHLWVYPEGYLVPVGFLDRMVGSAEAATEVGAQQRPFDDSPAELDAMSGVATVPVLPPLPLEVMLPTDVMVKE